MTSNPRVLFLAAEADPLIKVGGLGDVAGSLPPALRALGVDVRLAIPFHGGIHRQARQFQKVASFSIPHASGSIPAEVFEIDLKGQPVYLVSGPPVPPDSPPYTDDWEFDGHKYTFFSLAALELARVLDWQPDLLHANDWHTAPSVYSLALRRPSDTFYRQTASLLSVHNLPYLGIGSSQALEAYGLPAALDFHLPVWSQHLALPLGLLTADHIAAVSPGYAQEILSPEFGSGLHEFLRTRADSISGILNGLDPQRWDPAIDPALEINYDRTRLELRSANKLVLQRASGLKVSKNPFLIAMITRMDYQKGVDLAIQALRLLFQEASMKSAIQVIILGSGMTELEEATRQLESTFPDQVRAAIRYDPHLSRQIYGGADALLMPSRYEPCGLAQMIAMRYGCVPIARATGGLRDTIRDDADSSQNTGFLFTEASPEALFNAMQRALSLYRHPQTWQELQMRAMEQDFSWEKSANQYNELYTTLIRNRKSNIEGRLQ